MIFSYCGTQVCLLVSLILPGSRAIPPPSLDLSQQKELSPPQPIQDQGPLNRPLQDKQARAAHEKEGKYYRDWEKGVEVIITPEERTAFKKLGTNAERDSFIEAFWRRRDPTPDTEENEYKDEFYRRKAFANERFSAGVPGEQTDRGRIYILHGPPDAIESHPMGGPYLRPAEEGGGTTTTYPFEIWRYRHLDGIGDEVTIEFVDSCSCGDYRQTLNYSDKDAMKNIPNAGPTDSEINGASKAARLLDPQGIGQSLFNPNSGTKFFERMEQQVLLNQPPALRTLDTSIKHVIRYKLLPFDVRLDFVKEASENTVLVPITVQVPNRELTFASRDGVQRGVVSIHGQMTTLTGKIAQSFEDTVHVDVPPDLLDKAMNNVALYWKALPMRPGHYRLDIVVKDLNGDKLGTFTHDVQVPEYDGEKLASSSLILADLLEPVPPAEIGAGPFVLGTSKVRPRVQIGSRPASFKHGQGLGVWMQVYHLALDEKTGKPSVAVEYLVVNAATNQPVMDMHDSVDRMDNVGHQLTLQKKLSLAQLPAGEYRLTIKVNDLILGQTISPMTRFSVE